MVEVRVRVGVRLRMGGWVHEGEWVSCSTEIAISEWVMNGGLVSVRASNRMHLECTCMSFWHGNAMGAFWVLT